MKNKATLDQLKKAQALLEEHGYVINENSKEPITIFPIRCFEVGSLKHLADKEYYFSYSLSIGIAQDYSKIKRDEIFGVWEELDNKHTVLLALAYRGEHFVKQGELK